jgi:hypothetical protein
MQLLRRISAVTLASAAAGAGLALGAAPAALASHSEPTFVDATGQLLQPALRARTFAELQALGVDGLRVELYWQDVAPGANSGRRPSFDATNPASYHWGAYDAIMEEAQRLHWPVLLTVTSPAPKWATSTHRDFLTRPSPSAFEQFMTAAGRRFGSEVALWAIWNEPNQLGWLLPQWNRNGSPASPAIYRGLFEAGYRGLRAAGIPQPRVLMGETAPFGNSSVKPRREGLIHQMAPLTFLRGVLCLNARYHRTGHCRKLPAYGYAHHAYPNASGPGYAPPNRDQVTIAVLGRLTHALDRAARAGAIRGGMPVYLTEFGINTKPNPLGVTPAKQAVYDAIAEKMAWQNGRVAAFSQYLLRDDPIPKHHARGGWTGFQTGLETAGGGRKPLYYSFPIPLVVSRVRHGFSLWGLIRPAAGRTSAQVLVQPSRGRSYRVLATVHTDGRGYWSLRSAVHGAAWRVRWVSPTGTVYEGPPIPAS